MGARQVTNHGDLVLISQLIFPQLVAASREGRGGGGGVNLLPDMCVLHVRECVMTPRSGRGEDGEREKREREGER